MIKTLLLLAAGAFVGAAVVGAWFFYQVHIMLRRF